MDLTSPPAVAGNPQPAWTAAPVPKPNTLRAFKCRCGRPVFFRNSACVVCHTPLGYDPERGLLLPLEPAPAASPPPPALSAQAPQSALPAAGDPAATGNPPAASGPQWPQWRQADGGDEAAVVWRCSNLDTASACNWLVSPADAFAGSPPLCRCCRLTRTLPDLSIDSHPQWWTQFETAKRRLVSSLIGLGLPVQSKTAEDPQRGLVFDLLRAPPGGPPVITGHDDGVITLDVEEADDATRERRRHSLREPYRTLLGHLRHETGHYYWQRLVDGSAWLEPYRQVFGDERLDYSEALKQHYDNGAPADWGQRHVSSYASSHPWEDWAETWAHYLHMVETLDTARSFGVDGERVELHYERFTPAALQSMPDPPAADEAAAFLQLLNGWMELTGVLNELSRSMGVPDFYPFVLGEPAVRKLFFVERVVRSAAGDNSSNQIAGTATR